MGTNRYTLGVLHADAIAILVILFAALLSIVAGFGIAAIGLGLLVAILVGCFIGLITAAGVFALQRNQGGAHQAEVPGGVAVYGPLPPTLVD
jgi:hypothetical protein